MKKIYPVILSGGAGSRLWPTSRRLRPKQFLPLHSDQPMIIDTLDRVSGEGFAPATFVCSDDHRFLIAQSLKDANIESRAILLEPVARDTSAAIVAAALHIHASDPDAIILVLPSDHIIEKPDVFLAAVEKAEIAAAQGFIMTFGIVAKSPDTAFGYIRSGEKVSGLDAFNVSEFVEKPDLETAQKYLESGEYFWNSGVFVFSSSRFIEEMTIHAPELLGATKKAVSQIEEDLDFQRLPEDLFSLIEAKPIDKALMEKTEKIAMVPLDADWSDVGSWTGLWEASSKDSNNNAVRGEPILEDVTSSIIHSTDEAVTAVMGLDNIIVVNDSDALLVASMDYAQNVKDIVAKLKAQRHNAADLHATVYRPWGNYRNIGAGSGFLVKIITVYPDCSLSLQYHDHRAEHWVVVKGQAKVLCGDVEKTLHENQSTFIAIGEKHRLQNTTNEDLIMIEVQTGKYLQEDDITRLDDVYGRKLS